MKILFRTLVFVGITAQVLCLAGHSLTAKQPKTPVSSVSKAIVVPPILEPFRLKVHPNNAKTALLSVKGKEIEIYQFGKDSDEFVFAFGNFHGDEPQGEYILRQWMLELAKNPAAYARKTLYIMPLVNPDGTQTKNRVNANGVDLNRNFRTKNFIKGQHKGTRYYAGPDALSEPESQIVSGLIAPYLTSGQKEKVKIISIHAPLAVNNYDGPAVHIAQAMSQKNHLKATGSIGYPTPGSFGTYYGVEQGIPVITLETSKQSGELAWKTHRLALGAFLETPVRPTNKAKDLKPSSTPPGPPPQHQIWSKQMETFAAQGMQIFFPVPLCHSQEITSSEPVMTDWNQYLNCQSLHNHSPSFLEPTDHFRLSDLPISLPSPSMPTPTASPSQTPKPKPTATPLPKLSEKALIYISKKNQTLTLKDGDKIILTVPVSTARYSVSTPVGKFRIVSKYENPPYSGRHGYYPPKHPKNPLGTRWLALNVGHFRSGVTIGLHGTDVPNMIGKPVSDGCIRMRNSDVELIFKLVKVGTPVIISNQ